MKKYSFDDLGHIELDSDDSICLSETASNTSKTVNDDCDSSSTHSSWVNDIEGRAKRKVIKILKSIQKLEKLHESKKETKMTMLVFMDVIRDQQYPSTSMCLLSQFMKTCKIIPKSYYLHYYMFFLYYAMYYHRMRYTEDVIDDKRKELHQLYFDSISAQLNYLRYIINISRTGKISL